MQTYVQTESREEHMEIITVEGKQVVQCPHCDGTSLCKHASKREAHHRRDFQKYSWSKDDYLKGYFVDDWTYWLECSLCGEGAKHHIETKWEETGTKKEIQLKKSDHDSIKFSKRTKPSSNFSLVPPVCKVCGGKGYTVA